MVLSNPSVPGNTRLCHPLVRFLGFSYWLQPNLAMVSPPKLSARPLQGRTARSGVFPRAQAYVVVIGVNSRAVVLTRRSPAFTQNGKCRRQIRFPELLSWSCATPPRLACSMLSGRRANLGTASGTVLYSSGTDAGGSSQRSLSAHLFLEIIPFAISCPYHCYHEGAGLFGPACLL